LFCALTCRLRYHCERAAAEARSPFGFFATVRVHERFALEQMRKKLKRNTQQTEKKRKKITGLSMK
jgi:hypothetical protein